jgi:hypothetical protein
VHFNLDPVGDVSATCRFEIFEEEKKGVTAVGAWEGACTG